MATVDESRGEPGNGRANIFGDCRRAILWGGYGGDPWSIGGLGSAQLHMSFRMRETCQKFEYENLMGRRIWSRSLEIWRLRLTG